MPWLVLPSLNASLNLPIEATKSGCDTAAGTIEQTIESEYREARLTSHWLVLVTHHFTPAVAKIFGYFDHRKLAEVSSKLRLIGRFLWWAFPTDCILRIMAVRPEDGNHMEDVCRGDSTNVVEMASGEKYTLSSEAAALFDWLGHNHVSPAHRRWLQHLSAIQQPTVELVTRSVSVVRFRAVSSLYSGRGARGPKVWRVKTGWR